MFQAFYASFWVTLAIATAAIVLVYPSPHYAGFASFRRFATRYIPIVTFAVTLVAVSLAITDYAASENAISYADASRLLRERSDLPLPSSPQVQVSDLLAITSTLAMRSPASGIACTQVKRAGAGTWDVPGVIQVGGITLSDVKGVRARSFDIGGYDLAALIESKCGVRT